MGSMARYTVRRLVMHGTALAGLGCLQTAGALQFNHMLAAAVGGLGLTAGFVLLLTAASHYAQGLDAKSKDKAAGPQQFPAAVLPRWVSKGLTGFGVWLLLLVLVHFTSLDPQVSTFPGACPRAKLLGCSRVAVQQPHRAAGLEPLQLPTTMPAAAAAVRQWLREQPRTAVLLDTAGSSSAALETSAAAGGGGGGDSGVAAAAVAAPSSFDNSRQGNSLFLHARVVTLLWGFADDFFVKLTCLENGKVQVEAQGQLRLGVGDMEVNVARNVKFFHSMEQLSQLGQMPAGACH